MIKIKLYVIKTNTGVWTNKIETLSLSFTAIIIFANYHEFQQ